MGSTLDWPAPADSAAPAGMAVWMNTWLPQMIGVELPLPGSFTFHLTFSVSLHFVGGVADGATPVPSGPRHWGQVSPTAGSAARAAPFARSITRAISAIKARFCIAISQRP